MREKAAHPGTLATAPRPRDFPRVTEPWGQCPKCSWRGPVGSICYPCQLGRQLAWERRLRNVVAGYYQSCDVLEDRL